VLDIAVRRSGSRCDRCHRSVEMFNHRAEPSFLWHGLTAGPDGWLESVWHHGNPTAEKDGRGDSTRRAGNKKRRGLPRLRLPSPTGNG
jgi:hypothetical protein